MAQQTVARATQVTPVAQKDDKTLLSSFLGVVVDHEDIAFMTFGRRSAASAVQIFRACWDVPQTANHVLNGTARFVASAKQLVPTTFAAGCFSPRSRHSRQKTRNANNNKTSTLRWPITDSPAFRSKWEELATLVIFLPLKPEIMSTAKYTYAGGGGQFH
ncbi:hypothetical protein F5887DRAFT_957997 [Amanita rubescens]|nr:hypothetical protein F5887DRAFT_957997 [Amanita rubescens]